MIDPFRVGSSLPQHHVGRAPIRATSESPRPPFSHRRQISDWLEKPTRRTDKF